MLSGRRDVVLTNNLFIARQADVMTIFSFDKILIIDDKETNCETLLPTREGSTTSAGRDMVSFVGIRYRAHLICIYAITARYHLGAL